MLIKIFWDDKRSNLDRTCGWTHINMEIGAFTYIWHYLLTALPLFFTLTASEKSYLLLANQNKYPKAEKSKMEQNPKFSNEVNV